jgi:hypothetical protein
LPCSRNTGAADFTLGARSHHSGGVNVALCDAAVKFMNDDVDLATWRALSTRAGEDIPGQF